MILPSVMPRAGALPNKNGTQSSNVSALFGSMIKTLYFGVTFIKVTVICIVS